MELQAKGAEEARLGCEEEQTMSLWVVLSRVLIYLRPAGSSCYCYFHRARLSTSFVKYSNPSNRVPLWGHFTIAAAQPTIWL